MTGRPVLRIVPALLVALSPMGSVSAARLCRDGKGLFTPCPDAPRPARSGGDRRPHGDGDGRKADRKALTADETQAESRHQSATAHEGRAASHPRNAEAQTGAGNAPPAHERRGRPHLCRDLKGLYSPCPR